MAVQASSGPSSLPALPSCVDYAGGWRRYFFDSGRGSPAVLFLHGIPTNHRLWSDVIPHITQDWRVIAPDLTGFGLSDLPSSADLSPAGQAADMLAFLERRGVDRFTIVAHDYGALVAWEMLASQPDRVGGLIISNTSIRSEDWVGGWFNPLRLVRVPVIGELAFAAARRWMLGLAFKPFVANRDRFTDDWLDAFWEPFEHGFDRTLLRLFRMERTDREAEMRWKRALQAFTGRVRLVWGSQDPVFRPDRAAEIVRHASGAQVIMLENTSHFVPIDRPRVLARIINLELESL